MGLGRPIQMLSLLLTVVVCAGDSTAAGETVLHDLGHGVRLTLAIDQFEPARHRIERCTVIDWEAICVIDGRPVFGADWQMPRTMLTKATALIKGREIALDVTCMYNPGTPLPRSAFRVQAVEGGYKIRGDFSDGAGSYHAEWLLVHGASVRTELADNQH